MGSLKKKLGLKGKLKAGEMISRMNSMKGGAASGVGRLEKAQNVKRKSTSSMKCKNCGMNHKSESCAMKESAMKHKNIISDTVGAAGDELNYLGDKAATGLKFAGNLAQGAVRNVTGGYGGMLKKKGRSIKKKIKKSGKSFGKSNKLGGGGRFRQVEHAVAGKKGVYNPAGLAAYIGRKSLGKAKFQRLAAKGK